MNAGCAGKTLWDPLRTRAIPERLRGVFTTRRCTNPRLPYLYLCLWWLHNSLILKLGLYNAYFTVLLWLLLLRLPGYTVSWVKPSLSALSRAPGRDLFGGPGIVYHLNVTVHFQAVKLGDVIASLQVALRWQVQRSVAVVPKSNTLSHQRENISVSNSLSAMSCCDHCHCRVIRATAMSCRGCNLSVI